MTDNIFKAILQQLLDTDNDVRQKAEVLYDNIPGAEKNLFLLSAIHEDSLPDAQLELAAVLLRRLITTHFEDIYSKIEPDYQEQIKSQLLRRIQQNISPDLRKKISDVAAELARNYIDEQGTNHWPEYLQFLFNGTFSTDPVLREVVLLMFAAVPGVFGNQQGKYKSVIVQMLSQALQDAQSIKVRYAAVKAFSAFVLSNEKDVNGLKPFSDCLSILLAFFDSSLDSNDVDAEPDEILRCLIDMVENCPHFFRAHINELFKQCIKGISNTDNLPSTRQLCLEVVVTLSEAAPAMVRKLANDSLSAIIFCNLKMMTELEDEPNWDLIDDENADEDSESNTTIAEASLDRLACALHGKTIFPIVMNIVHQMLSSEGNWKDRYAGLMAISAIGEGCRKQMLTVLPKVMEGVLPFLFAEQNTRVTYAACNAIGQMSTDFAPVFQKKFHDKVIPALLQLHSDPSSARVQAHAGAALVNFFEDCPKNILSPYMSNIVMQLEAVLSSKLKELAEKGTKLVLEQVVVTLASLADSAQEKFVEYYDKFMPCLKFIIQNTNQPHLLILRGKTIECVSLIGLAVGREKFIPDASEVMDLLLKSQAEGTEIAEDDPQLSYMITAWARICKILGKDFKPYLQYVMGPVLKAAALKPEIALLDSDDMKVVNNEDEDWEFVHLGDKHNFGIRTAGLDDKATACTMLVCYAKELKESFVNYVEETVQLMIPMLKFYFHDGVRMAAGEIMPYLLESAKVKEEAYLHEMWRYILPPFLNALEIEPEPDVLCEHLASFSQCIDVLNCQCLNHEDLTLLLSALNKYLEDHFANCDDRERQKIEEDYDEVTEEQLLLMDEAYYYMLSKISELICTLFSTYRTDFFNYFDKLLPHYQKLLDPSRSWQDRQWALCVFADIIEYCGAECSKYHQIFIEPLLSSITDPHPDLRQTAAYAAGSLAVHGGPNYYEICTTTALPRLISVINDPDSRTEENERATENAISSVTKIFMSNNPSVNRDDLLQIWITWLPIFEDIDEVIYVFKVLCTLLEANNTALIGENNSNLPRIVYAFAEVFNKEAIQHDTELVARIVKLIKAIQTNTELFQVCLSHLAPNLQEALHKAITQ